MADEIDHIEELEKRLNARDPDALPERKYGILRPIKQNVASSWGTTEVPHDTTVHRTSVTGFKRFFIFSFLFFILALGVALFSIYRGAMTLSSKNVDLVVLGNSFVAGGEELPIQVEIANKNSADLVDAELTLDYPKGATDEAGSDVVHLRKPLGTIVSGKTKSEEFTVVLYGEQGISREIKATLSYKLKGSSAIFEKQQVFSVMVSSSPFALTVDAPNMVGANQVFALNVRNRFNGDKPLENAVVRVEYPHGFIFQSATPAPISSNNIWSLGALEKNTERTITVRGKLAAEEGDEKSFRVYVGARESDTDNRIAVTYNSALHTMVLSQPFMSAAILVDGQDSDIVALEGSSRVQGTVSWKNNSETSISDAVFTLALSGDSVDTDSITAENGYYNPLDRTITWTSSSDASIASIAPGASGQLPFSFMTRAPQGITGQSTLSLSVKGVFPERDYMESSVNTIDERTLRIASRLQFASQSLYSIGPLTNTGPFPPKVNAETTYSVLWTIRPTDNPVTGAKATAVLPTGVVWAGSISPQGEPLTYTPETRTVTWNIGAMPKATNIPQSKSVAFQIKVRPTPSQVGAELQLLGETRITGFDAIANVPLSLVRPALTTKLDTDPSYTPGKEKVLP